MVQASQTLGTLGPYVPAPLRGLSIFIAIGLLATAAALVAFYWHKGANPELFAGMTNAARLAAFNADPNNAKVSEVERGPDGRGKPLTPPKYVTRDATRYMPSHGRSFIYSQLDR